MVEVLIVNENNCAPSNITTAYEAMPDQHFQLTLAMGTALMESKCFLGFRLLSTNITIPGKVVGKVFALKVTLDGHLA